MDAKKNLVIDLVALLVYAVVANPMVTGIAVHEWIGLGLLVVMLVHCALHVDWVIDVFCRVGRARGAQGNTSRLARGGRGDALRPIRRERDDASPVARDARGNASRVAWDEREDVPPVARDKHGDALRIARVLLAVCLLLSFVACCVSGALISGTVLQLFGWYAPGYYFWDPLHAITAKMFLALIVVHLAVHAKWLISIMKKGRTAHVD